MSEPADIVSPNTVSWLLESDERASEALHLVVSRADAQGPWSLQQTLNDRVVVPIEEKGALSHWVTLRALRVLTTAGPLAAAS